MAIALVQHTTTTYTNVTSVAKAFGLNVGAGTRLLIADIAYNGAEPGGVTASDTFGSYTERVNINDTNFGGALSQWQGLGSAGGGADTVTIDFSGSTRSGEMAIYEYSGNDTTSPFADQSANFGGLGTNPSPGAKTPPVDGCLIHGAMEDENLGGGAMTAAANFTAEDGPITNTGKLWVEDWVQPAAASVNATWTRTTDCDWTALMTIYKPAAAGSGPAPVMALRATRGPRARAFRLQALLGRTAGVALNNYVFVADPGTYTLSGVAAKLVAGRALLAAPGSYVLTGAAAKLSAGRVLLGAPGAYVLTGAAAKLLAGRALLAVPGAYVLSGVAAQLRATRLLGATAGVYALSGAAAKLVAGRLLTAAPGAYAVSGIPAQLLAARVLNGAAGVYVVTGVDAQLLGPHAAFELLADPGIYVLAGADATLVFTPAPAPPARQPEIGGGGYGAKRRKRPTPLAVAKAEIRREEQWSATPIFLAPWPPIPAQVPVSEATPSPALVREPVATVLPVPTATWTIKLRPGAEVVAPPPTPDTQAAWQQASERAAPRVEAAQRQRQEQDDLEAILMALSAVDIL